GRIADSLYLLQALGRRVDHLDEGVVELLEQLLGDRLGVATRNGAEKHELQKLVVGQAFRCGAGIDEPRLEATSVSLVVRRARPFSYLRFEEVRGCRDILQSAAHGRPRGKRAHDNW